MVKGNGDAGDAAVHGGKGGIEVVAGVGEQVVDGHLGAGEDYGFGEILEHVAQHRGGVSHGISAVGDDDAVIGVQIFHHRPGDGLPLLSLDVGAVQVEDVPGVDVVVGAQVRHIFQQAPGRDLGLQSLVAPAGGDGAPGGEKQDSGHGKPPCRRDGRVRGGGVRTGRGPPPALRGRLCSPRAPHRG